MYSQGQPKHPMATHTGTNTAEAPVTSGFRFLQSLKGGAKRIAALMPGRWQQELKRIFFRWHIKHGTFRTDEPEWDAAAEWLAPGDWAIDVGANIGHYTIRFSELVGPQGRVIAFEPVPETFELLAANSTLFPHANATLLNLAASESTQVLGMRIPSFPSGLKDYYEATLTAAGEDLRVMTRSIDSLACSGRVKLLKIDAEGHDDSVLRGARDLIERDFPTLVMESVSQEVSEYLASLGYRREDLRDSPNAVYRWPSGSLRPELSVE